MKSIPFSIGNAAGIAIEEVNADATTEIESDATSVFAGLVLAKRGGINRVLKLTDSNFQSVLGSPIHPHSGAAFEPYRHVQTAVLGGNGYVIRVIAPGMMIPAISLTASAADTDYTLSVANSAFAAGTTPTLPDSAFAMLYIDDGDASTDRSINLTQNDDDSSMYTLELIKTDSDGNTTTLETLDISFDPEAKNDLGAPAYLPSALENNGSRMRAVMSSDAKAQSLLATVEVDNVAFIGGEDGDFTSVASSDYDDALNVLKQSQVNFTAILSLGCYDATTIQSLAAFAKKVRVDMFYDLACAQTSTNAIKEAKGHNLGAYHVPSRYYFPYTALDTYSKMQVAYGISCDAFVAKAKGVALVADVGGWHYSPAGVTRGTLNRTNIKPITGLDVPDLEDLYTARINPVATAKDGSVYINDALTTFSKNNYLRFQHVSSLMNAISRQFYDIASALQHEPDGLTKKGLTDGMTDLLERFSAAGTLVTPRDTTQGTSPFTLVVTQLEMDEWQVTWSVCPTGTARRIVGVPVLLR